MIRAARITDLPFLLDIETRSFPSDRLSSRQMKYHITNPNALFLCAENDIDKTVMGYILFLRRKGRAARFYSLVIDSAHRGKGYASALITDGITRLKHEGIPCIRLEVDKNDAKTIALYQKHGFEISAQLPEYYEDGRSAFRMEYK